MQQALLNAPEFDQISINELSEDQNRLSVDDKKRTLALSLANQIVAVVTAERSAEINRVGLKVALEQQEITKRKQALGAANGLDVVRAQQNAANARAALVSGDESLREAREALGLAIGIPEETGVAPDLNIDGLANSALESCHSVASVDERPDVASAGVQLDVAKRNLRNVWYTFLPTVSLLSTVAAISPAPAGYPNPVWSVQGVLEVPIWDGGTRYGNLRNARAAEDIACLLYTSPHQYTLTECLALADRNFPNLWAARARLALAHAQLEEAKWTPWFQWSAQSSFGVIPPINGTVVYPQSGVEARNITGLSLIHI